MTFLCTRERIGFRAPKLTFVWYPRRGFVEAWFLRWGALRHHGRWFFTATGAFVLSGGSSASQDRD